MRVDNFISKSEPIIKSTEKKTIHIVHILDRSGSMDGYGSSSKIKSALQGINTEVTELQKDANVNYLFSLVDFGDNTINKTYWQRPVSEVGHINIRANGGTPLYQAIGETLEGFPQTHPVLVKVFTDGGENASRGKYNTAFAVKTLLASLKDKDFTVTFVGTESDVATIQRALDIAEGNTLVHDNTAEGVTRSFNKSMGATMTYASNVAQGNFTKTLNFYQ